ncbi:hypothetical protein B0H11DRAFT_2230018 [Mycena galericulata]|nr:hypothetical protein B0H11DRAFT_2230018 [Mycena galericulata]
MSSANTCLDLVLYEPPRVRQVQCGECQDVLDNNFDDWRRRKDHGDWKRKKLALARVNDVCTKIEVLDKQLWLLVRNKKYSPAGYQQHLALSDPIRNMSKLISDMHQHREELIKRYTDIAPSPLFICDVLESHGMIDGNFILNQCHGKGMGPDEPGRLGAWSSRCGRCNSRTDMRPQISYDTYDICCQYSHNLAARLAAHPTTEAEDDDEIPELMEVDASSDEDA